MTKLAIYDKNNGESDRQDAAYFRHDYISKKNVWNRAAAGLGALILVVLNWARMLFVDGEDLFAMDFQALLTDAVLFILAVMILYSVVGTIQATRQYYLVQKRLNRYNNLLQHLERVRRQEEKAAAEAEEASHLYYGTDTHRKRNRNKPV